MDSHEKVRALVEMLATLDETQRQALVTALRAPRPSSQTPSAFGKARSASVETIVGTEDETAAMKAPDGCEVCRDAIPEPYTHTGWATEIIHRQTGIELVYIPAGEFTMGSPEDEEGRSNNESQRSVTLSQGFYMGKVPVTQEQWEDVTGENPNEGDWEERDGESLADFPVTRVSWTACQDFCAVTGLALPSEEQWEYACRAGSTEAFSGDLEDMAWYEENAAERLHPVGRKQPNAWGLYDMHGNVHEWCRNRPDFFTSSKSHLLYGEERTRIVVGALAGFFSHASAIATPDEMRVVRGGDFNGASHDCRSASRMASREDPTEDTIGFRVILKLAGVRKPFKKSQRSRK